MSYYPRQIRKVASTFLKPKTCKMWKAAITNSFLRLKMWKNMCTRKNGMGHGNKYDDRMGVLGLVQSKTQSTVL